jgi:hypothetical protein
MSCHYRGKVLEQTEVLQVITTKGGAVHQGVCHLYSHSSDKGERGERRRGKGESGGWWKSEDESGGWWKSEGESGGWWKR